MSASESDREDTASEREKGCPGEKSHTNAKSEHLFECVSPLSLCLSVGAFLLLQLLLAKLDALATLALWANLKCEHEAIHMHSLRNGRGELQLTCGYK